MGNNAYMTRGESKTLMGRWMLALGSLGPDIVAEMDDAAWQRHGFLSGLTVPDDRTKDFIVAAMRSSRARSTGDLILVPRPEKEPALF